MHDDLLYALSSKLWHIGPIDATKEGGIQSTIMPLSRCYQYERTYHLKRLQGQFASYTLFSHMRSPHENTCFQVYLHKDGFAAWYSHLNEKWDSLGEYLNNFVHYFGAPENQMIDGFSSQFGKSTILFKNLCKYLINNNVSAPRRPNESPAEGNIRKIKRCFYRIMDRKRLSKTVWDYLAVWVCKTVNLSVSRSWYDNDQTVIEIEW